ncbi:N-acetyl-gamma-glutamyl-phosphate reductase [Pseudochelatococcus contaminans]|uniref:N-acetyl-gamma-glutamyl-phosphate reductase n=1 Tax=Pseudochelatococcus contaminans TaxID=1538103 RepID=A0A7W5Z5H6_9HYPH|nr:N-acetyl-gamma-glutamyl-phosphate reductase [Pseudochelatococcus contaminans]MBB3809881.1 N-acetyl-gamma-glutamyl-phosphate reductase [Pseudochelatococcus contaminans]
MSGQPAGDINANPAAIKSSGGKPRVFIDGEAGTTGLGIRTRLDELGLVDVLGIDPALRKDADARRALMAEADLIILCLPDDAAREAVQLAASLGENAPRVLDASTAHRVADGWTYGFPEMDEGQAERVAGASHVANPGCYATGAIALLRPLVKAGVLPADFPISINAASGYSGGGKAMIADYESGEAPAFELYGLGLTHKHLPEIEAYGLLSRQPIFVPSVGNFRQGMLVSIPLFLDALPGKPAAADLHGIFVRHYGDNGEVAVVPFADSKAAGRIEALALNDTNRLEINVFANPAGDRAVLVARLDNLGKGASGAAVQNLRLMLGV